MNRRATRSPAGVRRATRAIRAGALVAAALAGAAMLSACGMLPTRPAGPELPAAQTLPPPPPPTAGAIYRSGQPMELFADLKARHVGDILTIELNEAIDASKSAVTKTTKTTTLANSGATLFGRTITTGGVPILTASLNGANSFDGEGSSTQSNTLIGAITVTVTGVEANGDLIVQGEKALRLNQGDEYIHLAGVVRPADIAANNTVTSDKVADARISYSGRGAVASSNRMGWLARFFNSPLMPF
ncbi:MAG: flagellar basal body L-ring protein FlgH [Gammaproteobacteria bacterium]|nr:flagellar basal body L-ring protein FlgH [Gammaproteobacteria bacterium]